MAQSDSAAVAAIERPSPKLLLQYALTSLVAGPGFPILFGVLFVRYRTLRYRFDEDGVSWSRGVLFRREVHLTYSRIQDIHLESNLLERYLGLARIQIQTASGTTGAEVTIEGLEEHKVVRDFIYARMRGLRQAAAPPEARNGAGAVAGDLVGALEDAAAALREVRELLARRNGDGSPTT